MSDVEQRLRDGLAEAGLGAPPPDPVGKHPETPRSGEHSREKQRPDETRRAPGQRKRRRDRGDDEADADDLHRVPRPHEAAKPQ